LLQDNIILSASNINKIYPHGQGEVIALRAMDIELRSGEITAIIGPSGSGKSTLLNILGLIQTPNSGQITVKKHDVLSLKEAKLSALRREMIGFLYQDPSIIPPS
jgi:putative ABC transport system ATP-binding protein